MKILKSKEDAEMYRFQLAVVMNTTMVHIFVCNALPINKATCEKVSSHRDRVWNTI
jgi:hypothetical protein